jgi:hypothetical protein
MSSAEREDVVLRPVVQWFAEQMELQLRANDHKGGWAGDSTESLLDRLDEEVAELRECSSKREIEEAADVANFAMMIADQSVEGQRIGDVKANVAICNRCGRLCNPGRDYLRHRRYCEVREVHAATTAPKGGAAHGAADSVGNSLASGCGAGTVARDNAVAPAYTPEERIERIAREIGASLSEGPLTGTGRRAKWISILLEAAAELRAQRTQRAGGGTT